MLPLAVIVAAAVLALWLLPALRRGGRANLAQVALAGLLAAMGVFLVLRGRLVIGAAVLAAAAAVAMWQRVRGLLAPTPPAAEMSAEEACAVLGLKPGAGEAEIRAAHRALIQKLHPDRGGNAYFAAKLNRARDVLLRPGSG